MKLETVSRLLKAFNTCPQCQKTMYVNELEMNDNYLELKCTCGWRFQCTEKQEKSIQNK